MLLLDAGKKKEDLYKVQDAAVHMGKEDVQGMRPVRTYEQYFDERKQEWVYSGDKIKIYKPNESEEDYQKRQAIYIQEKINRRKADFSGNMGGT